MQIYLQIELIVLVVKLLLITLLPSWFIYLYCKLFQKEFNKGRNALNYTKIKIKSKMKEVKSGQQQNEIINNILYNASIHIHYKEVTKYEFSSNFVNNVMDNTHQIVNRYLRDIKHTVKNGCLYCHHQQIGTPAGNLHLVSRAVFTHPCIHVSPVKTE